MQAIARANRVHAGKNNGLIVDYCGILKNLENQIAGRGRRYHRAVIDEAAFGKDGDTASDGSLMDLWEKSIKPTLFDFMGEVLVCSNSAGKNPDNFFYKICTVAAPPPQR
jgi:hypothetical protein